MGKRVIVPVPQRLLIGCTLAFIGGYMDAYTYFIRGGVFVNAQTGNIIFLGMNLFLGNWSRALMYLVPIASYIFGICLTGIVRRKVGQVGNLHWRQLVVLLELVLVAVIGYIPQTVPNDLVNVMVAFFCAVQVASFDKLEGMPFATTMCTGNLKHMTEHALSFVIDRNKQSGRKAWLYAAILLFFMLGTMVGTYYSKIMLEQSIWVCCYLLFFVLGYLLVSEDEAA